MDGLDVLQPEDSYENEWSIVDDMPVSNEDMESFYDLTFNECTDAKFAADVDGDWQLLSSENKKKQPIDYCEQTPLPSIEPTSPLAPKINEQKYLEHVVLPTDTLQGICLSYKISATRLRRVNNFSGNSLSFAPSKLIIPLDQTNLKNGEIHVQDTSSLEFKIHELTSKIPKLKYKEAKSYLENFENNVDEALCAMRDESNWKAFSKQSAVHPQRFKLHVNDQNIRAGQNINITLSVYKSE